MKAKDSSAVAIPTLMMILAMAFVLLIPGTIATGASPQAASTQGGSLPHASSLPAGTPLKHPSIPPALPAKYQFPSTFHPGATTPSPLPAVSSTIGVNYQATFDVSPQNEPGIAVNPLNPLDLIVSGNDYNTAATGSGGGSWASEFTSHDGGQTWTYHPAAMNNTFAGGKPCFGGDTNVFYGPDGTAYFAGLGYPSTQTGRCTTDATNGGLFVAHSSDNGSTWTYVKVEQDFGSYWVDKEWMGINPTNGVISIDVMNYSSTAFIDYWYSSDKGVTWHGPTVVNSATDQNMVAAGLAVDDLGGVDVIWQGGTPGNDIEFSRATAPGSAFSPELLLGTITCAPAGSSGFPAIAGVGRMNCFPQIIADTSPNSPYKGDLYVVYTTNTTSLQIQLLRSTDHGTTWTPQASAIAVNSYPTDGADHWFPQVTVGVNGTVFVEFMDRHYNSGNLLVDTTMAISTNGGQNFPVSVRISSVSGNPEVWSAFMGDYENTWWSPNGTFSVWTDFRNGIVGSNTNEDLYVGQLVWLNLSANVAGVTATVDGTSTTLNSTQWWNHGTVHTLSVPASTTVKGYTWAFQHWQGEVSSTNPSLTALTANGTSRLEAIYANSSLPMLTVTSATNPAVTATSGQIVEVNSTIRSGGIPVSGASVTFSDSLGDTFTPGSYTTGASGTAWSNFTAPPETSPTSDTITTAATAPGYNPGSTTVSITIIPSSSVGPLIVAYTASPNPIVATHTTYLNTTATGGTGPLTYTYVGLPTGCTTGNVTSLPCAPAAGGTFPVRVFVNDSAGHTANSTVNLTVIPYPAIASFAASPDPILVHATTYLNVSASGGKRYLAYTYTGLPNGCVTANQTSLPCAPATPGTFTVTVYANDTAGDSASTSTPLTVDSQPAITTFTASPDPIPVSHSTYLNVSASGGVGTLSYVFVGLPGGCATSNVASLPCAPSASGMFTIRAYANDTLGDSASSITTLQVVTLPTITAFAVTPATISLGSSASLSITAGGGRLPYTYSYAGLPSGCTSSNVSSFACTPLAPGSYTVVATVTDANGYSATAHAPLAVEPGPTITSFTALPEPVALGQAVYLNVTASGGYGPLTYTYTGLPAGCVSRDYAMLPCIPTLLGSYTVRAYANDTLGGSATGTALLGVVSAPQISSFTVSPIPSVVNTTVTIVVVVSGGSSPFTYSYSGLPPNCQSSNTANLVCTPTVKGNYSLQVTVTDANHLKATATTKLTVTSLPPGSGGGSSGTLAGLETTTLLFLLVVVAGIVAVGVGLLVTRRRKRGAPPPSAQPQQGPPPQIYGAPPGFSPPPPPPPAPYQGS